jgi:hypothetical protein
MTKGDVVYFRGKHGCRFGYFVEAGYKWARVKLPEGVKRVPVADVKPWPPAKPEGEPVLARRK